MPKRMLFCLLQRRGEGGREGGRGGKGRSQDAGSTLPPMGDAGEVGRGLYRTAEITNRAQDWVSPSDFSTCKTHAKKSELWTHSVGLLVASVF